MRKTHEERIRELVEQLGLAKQLKDKFAGRLAPGFECECNVVALRRHSSETIDVFLDAVLASEVGAEKVSPSPSGWVQCQSANFCLTETEMLKPGLQALVQYRFENAVSEMHPVHLAEQDKLQQQ